MDIMYQVVLVVFVFWGSIFIYLMLRHFAHHFRYDAYRNGHCGQPWNLLVGPFGDTVKLHCTKCGTTRRLPSYWGEKDDLEKLILKVVTPPPNGPGAEERRT